MTAYLIVRAQITDARDKEPFDRWYQEKHLPDAVAAFHPIRAWRGWSEADPMVHLAFYEYAERAILEAVLTSDALKGLAGEYDQMWGNRVPRSREVIVSKQMLTS
jgi:hypothetical protein